MIHKTAFGGGVGITPPTCTSSFKNAEIDWLSVTTDYIKYSFNDFGYVINKDSYDDLDELFKILTADKKWYKYDKENGINNYKHCIFIGQNIRVQLFGPKNRNGNYTTQIELNGSACDEFLNRGGSWINLIELLIKWKVNCTRLDFAIDDFSGKEITPYEIWELYQEKKIFFKTPFRNLYPMTPVDLTLGTYSGFGLYFGTRGRNQLLIYDKKLEQEAKGISVFENCWYRYEMRFVAGKATTILRDFLINYLESDEAFNKFTLQLLENQLDILDVNENDSNYRRWPRNEKWNLFLEDIERMKIINKYKPKTSIEVKREWINRSVLTALSQLFICDDTDYFINQLKAIGKKLKDLKDKDIEIINEELEKNNRPKVSKEDILLRSNQLLNI